MINNAAILFSVVMVFLVAIRAGMMDRKAALQERR